MSRNYFDLGGHQQDLDDEGYREDVRVERQELAASDAEPKIVRETCAFCSGGRVNVDDGTAFPGTVICHYCAGQGWFYTEAR